MSYSRAVEPRAAVALALMSLALLSALRRGGALRSFQLPGALARLRHGGCLGGARKPIADRQRHSGDGSGVGVGPEGSTVPDVVHRVVSVDELKVRSLRRTVVYAYCFLYQVRQIAQIHSPWTA